MSQINVDKSDKKEFDRLKPDDSTQAEFFHEVLGAYKRENGEPIDIQELVKEIDATLNSRWEIAAYRGAKDAIESHDLD